MSQSRLMILVLAMLVAFVLALFGGIAGGATVGAGPTLIRDGWVWFAEWEDGRGGTRGITRAASPEAIPGDTGRANVKAWGRMFTSHIELTYEGRRGFDAHVIPMERIVSVQFGIGPPDEQRREGAD